VPPMRAARRSPRHEPSQPHARCQPRRRAGAWSAIQRNEGRQRPDLHYARLHPAPVLHRGHPGRLVVLPSVEPRIVFGSIDTGVPNYKRNGGLPTYDVPVAGVPSPGTGATIPVRWASSVPSDPEHAHHSLRGRVRRWICGMSRSDDRGRRPDPRWARAALQWRPIRI